MLWLQYLDYCVETKATKAHSRFIAQALQVRHNYTSHAYSFCREHHVISSLWR
jgi:hypothetical protein